MAKQLATILVVSISKQGMATRTTDRFQGIKLACTLQHRILSIYIRMLTSVQQRNLRTRVITSCSYPLAGMYAYTCTSWHMQHEKKYVQYPKLHLSCALCSKFDDIPYSYHDI